MILAIALPLLHKPSKANWPWLPKIQKWVWFLWLLKGSVWRKTIKARSSSPGSVTPHLAERGHVSFYVTWVVWVFANQFRKSVALCILLLSSRREWMTRISCLLMLRVLTLLVHGYQWNLVFTGCQGFCSVLVLPYNPFFLFYKTVHV